jgi:hypothetical protein
MTFADGEPLAAALEVGSDGWALAWVPELPGCYAWDLKDAVLSQLPAAIGRYLQAEQPPGHALGPGRRAARVSERHRLKGPLAGGATEALLSADVEPLTAAQVERATAWRRRTAGQLQAVLVEADLAVWDFRPRGRRSLRQVIAHLEAHERTRQVALGGEPPRQPDLWTLLEVGHELWPLVVGREQRWQEGEESWTPAKVVRRACWHLAWHRDESAQRLAEWRSAQA